MADPATVDRLTVDQALSVLPDGEHVHTFISGVMTLLGVTLLGADWPRADAEEAIRKEGGAGLAGSTARRMGHGIFVTRDGGRPVFLETVEARLALVDPAVEVTP